MLISGTDAAHLPPAASAAVTEDGQSARQVPANGATAAAPTAATSDVPTTSLRNLTTADRVASSQRRGNLVLFVKANENESDEPLRGTNNASMLLAHNGGGSGHSSDNSQGGEGEEGGEGEQESLLSLIVSTAASGGSSALDVVTGAARKPLLTAAIVLLYFILLDVVMLRDNERMNCLLRRVGATKNDALVLLSSSLMRQLKEAQRDLHAAQASTDPPATPERLRMLQHTALALGRVCNRSIARLHLQLMFPGTIDDLAFLVEQHVDYDHQLQSLAAEELAWMGTAMASSVVQLGDEDAPAGQQFVLGAHAGAHAFVPDASTVEAPTMAPDAPEANPLRNVRLERTKRSEKTAGASNAPSPAQSRLERAAATVRRRVRGGGKRQGAAPSGEGAEAEVATGPLASILKNRFVAFFIICGLLAAVLRMG